MPETPWNRRTLLAEALWQEAFTPMMDWGPWYQPVQTYRKACEREPANAAYLVGLARALLKDAEPDLFRSARSTPNSDKIAEARGILAPLASSAGPERYGAACLLGLAEMAAGRPEAAAAALGPLVDTPGDSTAVRLGLGLLGVQTGRMDAASAHARKAVGLSPDSTLPRHLLALALLKQGMAAPAAAALAPCRAADRLDAGTLELLRRAALAGEDAARAGELARELERLRGCAGRQYEADMVRLGALEAGRLPDPRAIDTRRGEAVPGDAVGE
jgi:cytochrome c-type biogenesis protein CcmH/NrfG